MSDGFTDSERVKRMVEKDSYGVMSNVMSVVQSDIATVLGEFMHVTDMSVKVAGDGRGGYTVVMTVAADRFYDIGKTTDNA